MTAPRLLAAGMLTRRAFLSRVALASGALATAATVSPGVRALQSSRTSDPKDVTPTLSARAAPAAVVAFFDGQLWLDTSGTSVAYRAPRGARGAAPLATLTDEELRNLHISL